MEVDAAGVGVGLIVSPRIAIDKRLYPCAFFSCRINPAERNYDIVNNNLVVNVPGGMVPLTGGHQGAFLDMDKSSQRGI